MIAEYVTCLEESKRRNNWLGDGGLYLYSGALKGLGRRPIMWRGVTIFLVFVLLLTGWGLYFYQRSVNRLYEKYLLDQQERFKEKITKGMAKSEVDKVGNVKSREEQDKEDVQFTDNTKENVDKAEEQLKILIAEKEELNQKYNQLLERIMRLEKNYTYIAQENDKLRQDLKEKDNQITLLNHKLATVTKEKQNLEIQVQSLAGQVKAVQLENGVLRAKVKELNGILNSMDKLRQAMRDLKIRLRLARKRKREEAKKRIMGNRGYVIFNGKPTLGKGAKRVVEVLPVFD